MSIGAFPHTFIDGAGNIASGAEVMDNFNLLRNYLNGGVEDAALVSPNNSAYRTLASGFAVVSGGISAATWWPTIGGTIAPGVSAEVQMVPIVAAALAVAGKSTRLRMSIALACNATAIGGAATAKFGLYPISSVSGGAAAVIPVAGTVVSGSQVTVDTAWSQGSAAAAGADFALPADGGYGIGLAVTGTIPANVQMFGNWLLQVRNV